MKTTFNRASSMKNMLAMAAVMLVSGCSTIGYRCPLDPSDSPDSATACASMQDAMKGAKNGTGGKTSVLLDDKGRIIPAEMTSRSAINPLGSRTAEPYRQKSGTPVFEPPKVFQVWSAAFVDSEGNLHDGHHAWFSTPGRWAYGTVDKVGAIGANSMGPNRPDSVQGGRIVQPSGNGSNVMRPARPGAGGVSQTQSTKPAVNELSQPKSEAASQQERDAQALQNLANAANQAPNSKVLASDQAKAKALAQSQMGRVAAPGVTSPGIQLGQ